jgi:hypothetical protein
MPKQTSKGGGTKHVRDTRTGRYVPAKEAKRRPDTTVTETDKQKKTKKT